VGAGPPRGEGARLARAQGRPLAALAWRQRNILLGNGGRFMTKADMARAIADRMGLPQGQVREVILRVLGGITEALVSEGRLELRNFGVFEVKGRRPRRARNPRTGEAVDVPARRVVTFKSGRELGERVGRLAKVPGRAAVAAAPPEVSG
jgi:nucleoid DNA-binding protein